MKKLLAILLALCMVFTMMPITASAESAVVASGTCGDNLTWVLTEDGTLTISGTGPMKDYNSYVVDKGQTVYVLPFDHLYDKIKVAVVEEGVTYIGDHAFLGATELTTVTFPDSLTEIGDQVFSDSPKLTTINWGAGLVKTGIEVFSYCDGLTAVTLPQIDVAYGRSFFSGCANLSSVTIPATQTTLSETMFRNCKKLTQITLPNSLTKIGGKAFEGTGLTSIAIPNSVTVMDKGVFYNCDNLTQVEIPGSVSKIPVELFYSCDSLTKVVFHEGTTEMSEGVLRYCSNVQEMTIPSTVTKLINTFQGASGLKSVTFLGDAPEMSTQAFYGITVTAYYPNDNATWTEDKLQDYSGTVTWVGYDNSLASGTWGDNISWKLTRDGTLIVSGEGEVQSAWTNEYPWYGYAQQITRVIFELGVTNVPEMAFNGAYPNLVSANLKSVEVIGNSAFTQCYALTDVILPDTLKKIDGSAFCMTGLTSVDIPQGVTHIGYSAFYDSKLTEIVLPEGLMELGNDAFGWCMELKSAYLPDSITTIGRSLFGYCIALETANIPANLTVMPEAMFDGCSSLKSIEIPDGIEYMYMSNFQGSGLVSVTIPASVKVMGSPFADCLDLEEITFLGDAPEIMEYCFENVTATAYYPAGNETWTEEIMQNYGGNITWVPYDNSLPCDNGHHVPAKDDSGRNETGFCEYCDAICHSNGTTIWAIEEDGDMIIYGTGENGAGQLDYYDYLWTKHRDKIVTLTVEDGVTGDIFNFEQCTNLKTVYLSDDITVINKFAFALCSNLEQVNIPSGLTYLGSGAFQECKKLKEIYLPATITEIGSGVFANCTSLEILRMDENNPYYYTDDRGVLYGAYAGNGLALLAAPGKLSGHYTVSGDAEFILSGVFWGCADLTSVTISEGVQMLDTWVFKDCTSLKTVTFPNGLMEPGYDTFENCTALETVYFEGDAPYWFNSNFFKGVTATAYYPGGNETWTEEIMQDYGGNITWVPFGEVTNSVEWVAANATLTGSIDLNFSAVLSENLVNEDTFVRFTCAGKTVDVPMNQAVVSVKDGQTRYRFGYKVYAKEMTETVTAQVMTPNGPVGEAKSYSVAEYCNALMAVTNNAEIIAVCKAMLNYGAAAQMQFSYNLDNLANASLSEADKVVAKPDASAYAHKIVGTGDGIKAASAKLTLDADVAIRVTFQITGDKDVSEYQFLIDGEQAEPVADSGRYYIQLDGIAASKFDETHIFSVGDLAVHYSVLSYVNMVHNSNSPENLVNLINALYAYYAATEAYVN